MLKGLGRARRLGLGGVVAVALVLGVWGGIGSASSGSSGVTGGPKVGYISFAPVTASDWERLHWFALQAAAKKYHLKVSHQENVGFAQAAAVLARLARTNDIVIADSDVYVPGILKVAPKFPNTHFVEVDDITSTAGLKNFSGWNINWNEAGYLGGAAACFAAKARNSSTIGFVGAQPIPALTHFAGGVKDGATANGCKFLSTWTNSFTDAGAGKQAAAAMIGKGAGAMTSLADAGDEGAKAASQEKGVPWISMYTPVPGAFTALHIDGHRTYDDIARLWTMKQLKPTVYQLGITNGFLAYSTPFKGVPTSVQTKALAVQHKIKSGAIKVNITHQSKP